MCHECPLSGSRSHHAFGCQVSLVSLNLEYFLGLLFVSHDLDTLQSVDKLFSTVPSVSVCVMLALDLI